MWHPMSLRIRQDMPMTNLNIDADQTEYDNVKVRKTGTNFRNGCQSTENKDYRFLVLAITSIQPRNCWLSLRPTPPSPSPSYLNYCSFFMAPVTRLRFYQNTLNWLNFCTVLCFNFDIVQLMSCRWIIGSLTWLLTSFFSNDSCLCTTLVRGMVFHTYGLWIGICLCGSTE